MLREISERRNALEPRLRFIVRNQLKATLGSSRAKETVLDILGERGNSEAAGLSYADLFNPNISKLFFDQLRKIIFKNWEQFKFIFAIDKEDFDDKMKYINKLRADAHAKPIDKDQMNYFRVCISVIEKQVDDFLNN